MCELFALSSNRSVNASFSLETFSRHGGLEGPHKDGWGLAYYEGNDVRVIKEPKPAARGDWFQFVKQHEIRSKLIFSHIRKATRGGVNISNTQPFVRELAGRMHLFAHNGDLPGISENKMLRYERFHPVGTTDSEQAFCALMERMGCLWQGSADLPPPATPFRNGLSICRMPSPDRSSEFSLRRRRCAVRAWSRAKATSYRRVRTPGSSCVVPRV